MNASRRKVLAILLNGDLTEFGRISFRIQRRTLAAMGDEGLVKHRPYSKPPTWALTKCGREVAAALRAASQFGKES